MNKSIALYLLLAGLLTGFSCTHTKQQPEEEGVDSEWLDSLQHVYQYGVCIDSLDVTEYKMKNGDNPAAIFSALGFSALKATALRKPPSMFWTDQTPSGYELLYIYNPRTA